MEKVCVSTNRPQIIPLSTLTLLTINLLFNPFRLEISIPFPLHNLNQSFLSSLTSTDLCSAPLSSFTPSDLITSHFLVQSFVQNVLNNAIRKSGKTTLWHIFTNTEREEQTPHTSKIRGISVWVSIIGHTQINKIVHSKKREGYAKKAGGCRLSYLPFQASDQPPSLTCSNFGSVPLSPYLLHTLFRPLSRMPQNQWGSR